MDLEISREVEAVRKYYAARSEAPAASDSDHADERPAPAVGEGADPLGRRFVSGIPRTGTPPGPAGGPPMVPARPRPAPPFDEAPSGGGPAEGIPDDDPAPWPAEQPGDEGSVPGLRPAIQVITRTEWDDGTETGHRKISATYWSGDGVLTDDRDVPIRNNQDVVGADWLSGFGSPDDPDIVYVRNFILETDFEIARRIEGYAEVVLKYGKPQ